MQMNFLNQIGSKYPRHTYLSYSTHNIIKYLESKVELHKLLRGLNEMYADHLSFPFLGVAFLFSNKRTRIYFIVFNKNINFKLYSFVILNKHKFQKNTLKLIFLAKFS